MFFVNKENMKLSKISITLNNCVHRGTQFFPARWTSKEPQCILPAQVDVIARFLLDEKEENRR